MALPASGTIKMSEVNTELGNTSTDELGLNNGAVRTLFEVPSGAISLSDGWGDSETIGEINISIVADTDDAWILKYNDFFSTTSNYAQLGNTGYSNYAVLRFAGLNIPNGATIDVAYITLTAYSTNSGEDCNLAVWIEESDSAATYSTYANVVARSYTGVNWLGVGAWTEDSEYATPSLITLIQDIVDREGWEKGNSLGFLIGNNVSSANAYRFMDLYHPPITTPAVLHIEYSTE